MARNPQDINPEDVFPRRSLPDEAEPWGRVMEDRIIALEKAVLGQNGSVLGLNRNIAASTASLSESIVQLRTNYPIGSLILYSATTPPLGWFIADGSAVSRTDYADLFALIGTSYGAGDGSTTFNIPDLQGRVPVGLDSSQSEFDALGETGGAKTHTLSTAEMPSHTHTQNSHNHGIGSGSKINSVFYSAGGSGGLDKVSLISATTSGTASETATNQNTGGDGAHNNLQPYIALPYIIKHTVA